MIMLVAGVLTGLYLLFWPFSLRLDARLSPTSGRAEVVAASLFRVRLEGDFLQAPYLTLWRLDGRGRRRPLTGPKGSRGGFRPVLRDVRLAATLHVGLEGDGAATVEALGLAYTLLETLSRSLRAELTLRPVPCFDKTNGGSYDVRSI